MYASSTYKATKYLGYMLSAYGLTGWILFLANNFFDGKGGQIQQTTQYFVKVSPIVAIASFGFGLWRSISRKTCVDDSTQW